MGFPAAQIAFGGGELSPEVRARIDISKYAEGAGTLKNFFVRVSGGANNRAGLEYTVHCKDDDKVARLIEFNFNARQTYILIFQENSMRVIKDGAIVLEGSNNITAATQANPVVLSSTGHGFSNGEEVFTQGIIGMTELNQRFFIVAGATTNTFELQGEDGTGFNGYISGGTVSRVFDLVTPYLDDEIFALDFTQSNDVLTVVHPSYDPSNINRLADDNWTFDVLDVEPEIDAPASVNAVYSGSGSGITYQYVVTAFDEETGEESVASPPESVSGDLTDADDKVTITWTIVINATLYNIYKAEDGSGFYGFIGSASNLTFTDRNITPEFNDSPAIEIRNPFNGADNKPSTVEYFQGRRWYANSNNKPTTAWGSVSGNFTNFNVSKAVRDDDSITATLSSKQANEIRFLVPLGQLVIFTSGSEWLLSSSSGTSALITPSSVAFSVQSYWGVLPVKPLVIGNAAIYLNGNDEPDVNNPKFTSVRDIKYTLESDNFSGSELSILSTHLFEDKQIVDWAYAQVPFSLVWCIRNDGIALTMTYVAEQNIFAWTQHETAGHFESVAAVREGGEDAVYFVVRRKVGGVFKRFVERQHTRRFKDVRDWFGLDSGLTYDPKKDITATAQTNPVVVTVVDHGYQNGDKIDLNAIVGMTELNDFRYQIANATANTFTLQTNDAIPKPIDGTGFAAYESGGVSRLATDTVVGLDHLEGETVNALADGNVLYNLQVTDGAISLGAFYSRVHVGLPYSADLETIDAIVLDKSGVIINAVRKVDEVVFRFVDTRGGQAGSSADTLYDIKWRTTEEWGRPGALSSADYPVTVESSWDYKSKVFYRQSDPLPVTILSLIPTLDKGDD